VPQRTLDERGGHTGLRFRARCSPRWSGERATRIARPHQDSRQDRVQRPFTRSRRRPHPVPPPLSDQLLTAIVLSRRRRRHYWLWVPAHLSVETRLDVSACLQVLLEWPSPRTPSAGASRNSSLLSLLIRPCGRPRPSSNARSSAPASRREIARAFVSASAHSNSALAC
jgi:hypothetical protein